ncbi:flagellar protein [Vallitaleaceae bacterium 9-2]
MDVRNCKKCGRIFNYVGGQPICAQCKSELENKFTEVKTYIRRNPTANIGQVAEECDVDTRQIRQWVREERLIFSADSAMGIECEKCGKSIRTGRFCDDCKRDTANELSGAYQSHKVEEDTPSKKVVKSRMRFLDKEHRN